MTMKHKKQILNAILASTAMVISFAGSAAPLLIIDNTGSNSIPGITTNLPTSDGVGCQKDTVLKNKTCNSFDIASNRFQVVNRAADDSIEGAVGVTAAKAGSYSNKAKTPLTYFTGDNHAFDLDKLRTAADTLSSPAMVAAISALPSPPALESYGTISWPAFIKHVAVGTPLYGIVRVKVPITQNGGGQTMFCPKMDPAKMDPAKCAKCGCAPDSTTKLIVGASECGITLTANAQFNVRGSLFIDFVDCDTGIPVTLTKLKKNAEVLKIKVEVPINVNPANPIGTLNVVNNIRSITDISCALEGTCNSVISGPIPFTLVPPSSFVAYKASTGTDLNATIFNSLSRADQYHLLLPSGYVDGWAAAFAKLNIGTTTWAQMGFGIGDESLSITKDMIRSDKFEDIPALLYTGGLVDMHHHVNVSGLVYVPQSIELEQKMADGIQYIAGAIMVRDGFYVEGNTSGNSITYFANDPGTYSQIPLATTNPAAGTFTAYTPPVTGASTTAPGPQWVTIRPRAK